MARRPWSLLALFLAALHPSVLACGTKGTPSASSGAPTGASHTSATTGPGTGGQPSSSASGNGGALGGSSSSASGNGGATGGSSSSASGNGGAVGGSSSSTSTGAGGACATLTAQPDVDPWTVRAPGAGFGSIVAKTETDNAGTFTDVYLESPAQGTTPAGYTSIGVRVEWGGSIVFFGLPGGSVVDDHDTGREAQIALYDQSRQYQGCAYDASCTGNGPCGTTGTFLGWDPVQGGDRCENGSPSSYAQSGDSLVVTASPVMWNPNWDLTACTTTCPASAAPGGVTITMSLRYLSTTVVEVATEAVEQAGISHTDALQEFPCLYPSMGEYSAAMDTLLDASGTTIPLSAAVTNIVSPAPWIAWQDMAQTYGVGLGADQGITSFFGILDDSVPYRYSRANAGFSVGAGAVLRGISYLALGDFATIQASMKGVLSSRPPFGHIDVPASGATTTYVPGAPLTVAGWVLDTAQIASVSVLIDGTPAASLPVATARPDVCGVYPNYDGCPTPANPSAAGQVGFSGPIETAALSPCEHLLRVTATDADQNTTVLGERVIAPQ